MKKRILHLIPSFHLGGSEKQAIALIKMLIEDGSFDVLAATLNSEGVLRAGFNSIFPGEIPEYKLTSFHDLNFLKQVRNFARFLKENRIDLLHTHDFYSNVFGMSSAVLARTPSRIASKRESGGLRTNAQDIVEKMAFSRADAVLVNSKSVMDHLAGRKIPTNKLHLVYNGTDVSSFEKIGGERTTGMYGLPSDENIRFVTLVANLRHAVKNVPMLLRVAKRVTGTYPNAHFIIAGEGELAGKLKTMAEELGVADRVHFIGRCDDVPALLAASYACVLTSDAEGFSNSLIEYMAAGKPVVATAVGGAAEVMRDGVTGFLCAPDNDEAMAKYLCDLLSDEGKAKKMGESGKRTVIDRFSMTSQQEHIVALYNDCLRK